MGLLDFWKVARKAEGLSNELKTKSQKKYRVNCKKAYSFINLTGIISSNNNNSNQWTFLENLW